MTKVSRGAPELKLQTCQGEKIRKQKLKSRLNSWNKSSGLTNVDRGEMLSREVVKGGCDLRAVNLICQINPIYIHAYPTLLQVSHQGTKEKMYKVVIAIILDWNDCQKLRQDSVCCLLSWSQFVENVCWLYPKVVKFALPSLLIFPKLNIFEYRPHSSSSI